MLKARSRMILQVFLFCMLPASVCCQYHLGELGILGGPSATISNKTPGIGSSLSGPSGKLFYSHWICGKRHGYILSSGIRTNFLRCSPSLSFAQDTLTADGRIYYHWLEAGIAGKIRKNDYHRSSEFSMIAGAKTSVNMNGIFSNPGGNVNLNDLAGVYMPRLNFVFHLAMQYRHKFRQQAIYLEPGFETCLFPELELSGSGKRLRIFSLTMQAGFTFWNSKQRRIRNS